MIETERATIESSISGGDISKLALNFRATNNTSPIVVATLAQGVQQDRGGQISLAGALPFMTSFSVDGISTQRVRYGGPSRELFPSVESIEEFKVTTANNNAEFMQVTDITTTSRSGDEPAARHGVLVQPEQRLSATTRFTPARCGRQSDQAGHQGQQLRHLGRRADRPQPRLLLRHLRRACAGRTRSR